MEDSHVDEMNVSNDMQPVRLPPRRPWLNGKRRTMEKARKTYVELPTLERTPVDAEGERLLLAEEAVGQAPVLRAVRLDEQEHPVAVREFVRGRAGLRVPYLHVSERHCWYLCCWYLLIPTKIPTLSPAVTEQR